MFKSSVAEKSGRPWEADKASTKSLTIMGRKKKRRFAFIENESARSLVHSGFTSFLSQIVHKYWTLRFFGRSAAATTCVSYLRVKQPMMHQECVGYDHAGTYMCMQVEFKLYNDFHKTFLCLHIEDKSYFVICLHLHACLRNNSS